MPGKPGWCIVNGGDVPENFNTVARNPVLETGRDA